MFNSTFLKDRQNLVLFFVVFVFFVLQMGLESQCSYLTLFETGNSTQRRLYEVGFLGWETS